MIARGRAVVDVEQHTTHPHAHRRLHGARMVSGDREVLNTVQCEHDSDGLPLVHHAASPRRHAGAYARD
jgi:hypothetical protein